MNQVVCAYCRRKMEPHEYRAFSLHKKYNDIICPQCFKIHAGSEDYQICMFAESWIIDGVKYPR